MLRLRGVQRFRDRHGKERFYFRKRGAKAIPLPGAPGSEEFMAAYHAAQSAACMTTAASKAPAGSLSALIVAYFKSTDFLGLAKSTQSVYRNIFNRLRDAHGTKPVAMLERHHIKAMMAERAASGPQAANSWLKRMRRLMQFAIEVGDITDDPTLGIKRMKIRSGGFHTWTEDEIAKFEKRHEIGGQARLAFALLLYTGQRRGDIVKLGRQHLRGGVVSLRQSKTGAVVDIPVHTALQAVLDGTAKGDLTFLQTSQGNGFTAAGFGNWFRERCNEAEVPPQCSAHGLRKAAARRLAEAGCTEHEIMSITGHDSLAEVQRYTRAANRQKMASNAIAKIEPATSAHKPKS